MIGSAVMWWILGYLADKNKKQKEESLSNGVHKSKFQQRLEELAEEQKRKRTP